MDKRSRAYNIYKAGKVEIGTAGSEGSVDNLLSAIAAMIDYATRKPARKSTKPDVPKLGFQVADLLASCGANPDTTPGPLFGRVGALAQQLGVTPADVQALDVYMSAKGGAWYAENGVIITAPMVIKKLPEWLSAAREYGGGSVPAPAQESFR